jgi:hypothetical protein
MRKDSTQYTHTHVDGTSDGSWKIRVIDEPNDIVIIVQYAKDLSFKPLEIIKCDKSGHDEYHIHGILGKEPRVIIPDAFTRDQKIEKGFDAILKLVRDGLIRFGDDIFSEEDMLNQIKQKVIQKSGPLGASQHSVSISAKACIIKAGKPLQKYPSTSTINKAKRMFD